MRPLQFSYRLPVVRGFPGVLALVAVVALAIGAITLVVFVGLIAAVVGIGVYAAAALYFKVKRALGGGARRSGLPFDGKTVPWAVQTQSATVRDVEVEVLPPSGGKRG